MKSVDEWPVLLLRVRQVPVSNRVSEGPSQLNFFATLLSAQDRWPESAQIEPWSLPSTSNQFITHQSYYTSNLTLVIWVNEVGMHNYRFQAFTVVQNLCWLFPWAFAPCGFGQCFRCLGDVCCPCPQIGNIHISNVRNPAYIQTVQIAKGRININKQKSNW
jgi:hypothetical protein